MTDIIQTRFEWRRGTAAQWATANPVLLDGEPGRETDTGKWKLGDGVTRYNDLPYQAGNEAALSATYVGRLAPSGDAATALATAFNDGNQEVIVSPGAYTTTGTVNVPAGKTLTMQPGASIARSGTATGPVIALAAGSTLRGGKVDGGASSTYAATVNGDQATVHGVTITAPGGYGVGCSGFNDLRVTGNYFTECQSYALLCEGASARPIFANNHVYASTTGQGCMFKDGVTDGVMTGNAIQVAGTVGLEVFGATTSKCSISGNTVRGPSIGISLSAATGCAVTGNTIQGCGTIGIENAEGASGNSITGNSITGGTGTGILASTSDSTNKPLRNVNISDNTISGVGSHGINTEYGHNLAITGNIIADPASRGIFVNNGGKYFTVNNNTVVRTVAATDPTGIYLSGQIHTVVGNRIDYALLATQAGYAIDIEGATRTHVSGNHVIGSAKGIAIVGASSCSLFGNTTAGTTEHSVFTSGAFSNLLIQGHWFEATAGVGVDTSGVASGAEVHGVWNNNNATYVA